MTTKFRTLEDVIPKYSRYIITALVVLIAFLVLRWLWIYYQIEPWTRDARLRADVVRVAPDVSGLVTMTYVKDNEPVKQGQKLFAIDSTTLSTCIR